MITVIDSKSNSPYTGPYHWILMIIKFNGLMVQRKSFKLIVEEEIHSLFIQFKRQAL